MKSDAARGTFPFGQPVRGRRPVISESRPLFILGAYPSALHVKWEPPYAGRAIKAMAIDNEPDFFWDGHDPDEKKAIAAWAEAVGYRSPWGRIEPARRFNGSSGLWVNRNILEPMDFSRKMVWLSDCLDAYRCSERLADALRDKYNPLATQHGWKIADLEPHPNEREIVAEALAQHRDRLVAEITSAIPEIVVTLGNAALRVFRRLISASSECPTKLSSQSNEYGRRSRVRLITGHAVDWIPLAHPAAPPSYQTAHREWAERIRKKRENSA